MKFSMCNLKNILQSGMQQVAIVVTAVGCAGLVGSFYSATGESMLPTITPNSIVFVDSLSSYFRKYQKGDIIIVQSLHNQNNTICKRIIHTEGDKFQLKNGREVVLDKRQIWVEGDNKSNSFDSRNFGPVSDYLIIGRVKFSLFPFKKFQLIQTSAFITHPNFSSFSFNSFISLQGTSSLIVAGVFSTKSLAFLNYIFQTNSQHSFDFFYDFKFLRCIKTFQYYFIRLFLFNKQSDPPTQFLITNYHFQLLRHFLFNLDLNLKPYRFNFTSKLIVINKIFLPHYLK